MSARPPPIVSLRETKVRRRAARIYNPLAWESQAPRGTDLVYSQAPEVRTTVFTTDAEASVATRPTVPHPPHLARAPALSSARSYTFPAPAPVGNHPAALHDGDGRHCPPEAAGEASASQQA